MKILVEVNTEKENEYVYSKVQCTRIHEWRNCRRFLDIDDGSYYQSKSCAENNGYKIISFEEFKSRYEPQLKTGDTFEYNGFVCRVESEVKKWYYNTRTDKYVRTKHYGRHLKEITNKEFIKQLEENAR